MSHRQAGAGLLTAALWCALSAVAWAQEEGGEAIAQPTPEVGPPVVELPDKPATILRYSIERDDDEQVVRLTFHLSYPKHAGIHSRFVGQGSFEVTIPGTKPAPRLPQQVAVAEQAVADMLLRPAGGGQDTVVVVRLNTPTQCRAYPVPSQSTVVIEVNYPPAPPTQEEDHGRRRDREGGSDTVSASFVDTDIKVIIESLMTQSGQNIMLVPGVTGTYSLTLRKVTLAQALDALWEAWDLVWMELPGPIYLVGTDEDIGSRRIDQDLTLPEGWDHASISRLLEQYFPEVKVARDLAGLDAHGPLPVYGPLREVGRARRWLAKLPLREEGTEHGPLPLPPGPRDDRPDRTIYFPKNIDLATARSELEESFPELKITVEEDLQRITIEGRREDILRARALLRRLDVEPDKQVEEAMWLPLIPAESITKLAAASGVELTVVYTDAEATLVYARGPESKVVGLRSLVTQMKEWLDRRKEQAKAEQPKVTRTYELKTLSAAHATRLIADQGAPVVTSIEGEQVRLTGAEDAVTRLYDLLEAADQPLVQQVYHVRYARTQDLVRMVRAAVPDLKYIDYHSRRLPGKPETVDPARLGPPEPAGAATREAGPDGTKGEDKGPPEPGVAPPDRLGPGPQLLMIGTAEAVQRALDLLAEVDAAPLEVELAAVVAAMPAALVQQLGLGLPRDGDGGVDFGTLAPGGLRLPAVLEAVDRDPQAVLLARPRLRAVDGTEAKLLIGRRVGFQILAGDAAAGPAEAAQEEVGISLWVTPEVPGDGTILCHVRPEVSRLSGYGDQGLPEITTREAEATVRLPNGGILVVSGLLESAELPLVGELFEERLPGDQARELVILLSARVIPPGLGALGPAE